MKKISIEEQSRVRGQYTETSQELYAIASKRVVARCSNFPSTKSIRKEAS